MTTKLEAGLNCSSSSFSLVSKWNKVPKFQVPGTLLQLRKDEKSEAMWKVTYEDPFPTRPSGDILKPLWVAESILDSKSEDHATSTRTQRGAAALRKRRRSGDGRLAGRRRRGREAPHPSGPPAAATAPAQTQMAIST